MIKRYFFPLLKRFIGLFISMGFVSLFSISLFASFSSSIDNLKNSFSSYEETYERVDGKIETGFFKRTKLEKLANNVDGVNAIEMRYEFDGYIKRNDDRTIVTRLVSYVDADSSLVKRYVMNDTPNRDISRCNISVVRKFAENNNFQVGDNLQLGFSYTFFDAHIESIVEVPEAMSIKAHDLIWTDSVDFGIIYISNSEISRYTPTLARQILTRYDSGDEEYRNYVDGIGNEFGLTYSDLERLAGNPLSVGELNRYANEVLLKLDEGADEDITIEAAKAYIVNRDIKVKNTTKGSDFAYRIYIDNCIKQLNVAVTFFPIFLYVLSALIIIIFLNQMIQSLSTDIGIMKANGISNSNIIFLFVSLVAVVILASSIFAIALEFGLNYIIITAFKAAYSIPNITLTLSFKWSIIGIGIMLGVGIIATISSCLSIFKITPKEAISRNTSNNNKKIAFSDKFSCKTSINLKLSMNSIARNKGRFFASIFSTFAALSLILITLFFYVSKETIISQTVEQRINYDCQVYCQKVMDDDFLTSIKAQASVTDAEECYFSYVEIKGKDDRTIDARVLGVPTNESGMLHIYNKNDKLINVSDEGIILAFSDAAKLGVKAGDMVVINNIEIKVSDLSNQYFNMTEYISTSKLESLGVQYVSTYLVNIDYENKDINNENEFLEYIYSTRSGSVAVFSSSIKTDWKQNFISIDIFVIILVIFSVIIGVLTLAMMAINALMKEKRTFSIMRSIGFLVSDISKFMSLQNIITTFIASLLAVPLTALLANFVFANASTSTIIYPFVFNIWAVLISFCIIVAVVIFAHFISMNSIKKWNLADNTRARE